MAKHDFSTLELTGRFEDRRDIKNVLGKFLNAVQLNHDLAAFDYYWSKEKEDISLGFNNGFYRGQEAVSGYFNARFERNRLVAKLLQEQLPEELGGKSEEEIYGTGELCYLPSSSPIIELAQDAETAKGIWTVLGNSCKVTGDGPASYWTWGYFCVDFIREGIDWKIWHMMFLTDIYHLAGQNWALPEVPLPKMEGYDALNEFKMPEPTEKVVLREYYDPMRKFTKTPRIPVPYRTFSETFSYGQKEGAIND